MSEATTSNGNEEVGTEVASRQEVTYARPWYQVEGGEEGHTLRVAMPGVAKAGVEISLEEDQLSILGHRQNRVPSDWKPVFEERAEPDFRLRLRLNVDVDPDKIAARMEEGVLTLTLPVREEAKPRTIEIN